MESGDLGKDKYEALEREIIATEQELKNLAREAAEANTALNKIDSVGRTFENIGQDDIGGYFPDQECYCTYRGTGNSSRKDYGGL